MKTSQAGIDLIKSFEGLRTTAYLDSVGVPTIGYGHTAHAEAFRDTGLTLTEAQCETLLRYDLRDAEAEVNDLVKVVLTQPQFDALVAFTFNVGSTALAGSTLLKLLNQADYEAAAAQFGRWNKAGGRVLAGLTRRRAAERKMFEGKS